MSGKHKSFAAMVRQGWPIHIGGMTDPMPPVELYKRVFYNALSELAKYDHPVVISTKSALPLQDSSYIDLFVRMKDRLVFQMSIMGENVQFLEPYAPSAQKRIEVLERIAARGVNCLVRLQPFMPQLLDQQRDLFKMYADVGVKAVTVEGLKLKRALRSRKIKWAVMRQFGVELNLELTERRYSKRIYPTSTKIKYHLRLRDMAHDVGLQYLVADNNLRFLGDSPNCCGTDLIGAKTNCYNVTYLAYTHPDDFGFHLIKDVEQNEYMTQPVKYAGYKDNIYETLRHLYNDEDWMYDTYKFTHEDEDGNKHFRVIAVD
jgi:DNA repair photolyase